MEKEKNNESKENRAKGNLTLRFFCTALELIGWIQIVGGAIWFVKSLSGSNYEMQKNIGKFVSIISLFSFDFFFLGLMAVILAHLARYIFDKNFHKIHLLRFSDKILYIFAVFTICWAVFRWFNYIKTFEDVNWQMILFQSLVLPTVVKVLILVCLAQILKRILPVIEEYKSLV